MENNPYAPPKAAVADVEPAATDALAFFPVSNTKLIVMSTMTLTLYQFFWFYKNWACVRARGGHALPLVRTVFAVFFCYPLFRRVRNHRRDLASGKLPAGLLASGWIVVTLLSNLYGSNWLYLASLLASYLSVGFFIPVQNAINAINRAERPDHDPNAQFTIWNALWMVLGGALTVVGLSETFFPAP